MNAVIVIPSRYDSSRFPGKPLIDIAGKSLISRVWNICSKVVGSQRSYVATDDDRIQNHCLSLQIPVIMTSGDHTTGTDRVFEAVKDIECDCVINVQGDEPLISPDDIDVVLRSYYEDPSKVYCGMAPIDSDDFSRTSVPKVVTSKSGKLLYISRSSIPTTKNLEFRYAFRQVCIYAFHKDHLEIFSNSVKTPLESVEDIEILRFLESDINVQMIKVSGQSVAIDYPEDVDRVTQILQDMDL